MNQFQKFMISTGRPIALAAVFIVPGFLVRSVLNVFFDVALSKLLTSMLNFVLAAFAAFVIFPNWLKQPFGNIRLPEYLRRLGFYKPEKAWKHVLMGVLLALCTLAGMLAASILTGRYTVDWHTINLPHIIFSLNPGIWEEFFFRGIIMAILIRRTGSFRQAAMIQILIFGLLHISEFGLWPMIDVISVMVLAMAFTYTAYKTRALLAGIVFHFLHDALLFFVQVPEGEYNGTGENIPFYAFLWFMVIVGCLFVKISAEKYGVRAKTELYITGKRQE